MLGLDQNKLSQTANNNDTLVHSVLIEPVSIVSSTTQLEPDILELASDFGKGEEDKLLEELGDFALNVLGFSDDEVIRLSIDFARPAATIDNVEDEDDFCCRRAVLAMCDSC